MSTDTNQSQPAPNTSQRVPRKVKRTSNASDARWSGKFGRHDPWFEGARIDEPDIDDHFAAADIENRSADAQFNFETRDVLMQRARFETENNGWMRGMSRTFRNDVCGTTPRVQFTDTRLSPEARLHTERLIHQWWKDLNFAQKFRCQVQSHQRDGQGLGVLFPYPGHDLDQNSKEYQESLAAKFSNPVKIGYRLFDPARMQDWYGHELSGETEFKDGKRYNDVGECVEYRILKYHPGTDRAEELLDDGADPYLYAPADRVVDLFEMDRPEQNFGVTQMQPLLRGGALLRQWRTAVVRMARKIARWTPYIKSTLDPATEDTLVRDEETGALMPAVQEYREEFPDDFVLDDDQTNVVPEGWEAGSLESESALADNREFTHVAVNEMGAGLNIPFTKASKNTNEASYAGGQLENRDHEQNMRIIRYDLACNALDKTVVAFMVEAARIGDVLHPEVQAIMKETQHPQIPEHHYHWDGSPEVDPQKTSNAEDKQLRNMTTTHDVLWAKRGRSAEDAFAEQADLFGVDVAVLKDRVFQNLYPDLAAMKASEGQGSLPSASHEQRISDLESVIQELQEKANV